MMPSNKLYDELDMILEEAKKHPHKVKVDYTTRIRVWEDQILPNKRAYIRSHPSTESVRRMTDLILRDALRLYRRALREHVGNIIYINESKDEMPLVVGRVIKALEKQIEDIYIKISDLVSGELLVYENILKDHEKMMEKS